MSRKIQRESLYTIVGLAVLSAVFLWGFYLPERKAGAAVRGEIADLQGTIRNVPVRVAELDLLRRRVEKRDAYLQKRRDSIPRSAEISAIIKHVASLARNADLRVTRLEPLPAVTSHSYQTLPFRIGLRGRFVGMVAFLKGLESDKRLVTFDAVSLKREQQDDASPIEADIYFSVYSGGGDSADPDENDASPNVRTADTEKR